jgi:hypothetical protein
MNGFELMTARNIVFRDNIERSLIGKRAFFNADADEIFLDKNGSLEIVRVNVEILKNNINVLAIDKESNTRYYGDLPYSDLNRLRETCDPERTL